MGTEALHGATPQGCMRTLGAQTAPSANRWVRSRHQAQISTSFSLCCCAGIHKPGSVDSTSCIACRRIVGGGDSPPASALSILYRRHRCRRHRCQAPASLAHVAAFSCPLKYPRLPPEQQSAPPARRTLQSSVPLLVVSYYIGHELAPPLQLTFHIEAPHAEVDHRFYRHQC